MKIIEYILVTRNDADELIERINIRIAEGWKPQGGISVTKYLSKAKGPEHAPETKFYYCQAMILVDG